MRGTTTSRGLTPTSVLMMVLMVIVLGGLATVVTLIATGTINLAAWFGPKPVADPNAGKIAVIIAGREVPMYAKVISEHLTDPAKNEYSVRFDKSMVQADWLTSYDQILGRVMKRDKLPGKVFTEKDFYPEGTAPGRVAGIPAGMSGVTVDASKIKGLAQLNIGDHFDIIVNTTVPTLKLPETVRPGITKRSVSGNTNPDKPTLSLVRVLARNGVVVQLKDDEAMIAIDPKDSLAVTHSLTTDSTLYCIARSGQPSAAANETLIPDEPETQVNIAVIEMIKNRKVSIETFATDVGPAPRPAAVSRP